MTSKLPMTHNADGTRRRAFVHPHVEALSERMTALFANLSADEPMNLLVQRRPSDEAHQVAFDGTCIAWLITRHAELPWIQMTLIGAGLFEAVPETEFRPTTRKEARDAALNDALSSCAAGLLHFIDEHVELLEMLVSFRRMEDAIKFGTPQAPKPMHQKAAR